MTNAQRGCLAVIVMFWLGTLFGAAVVLIAEHVQIVMR